MKEVFVNETHPEEVSYENNGAVEGTRAPLIFI